MLCRFITFDFNLKPLNEEIMSHHSVSPFIFLWYGEVHEMNFPISQVTYSMMAEAETSVATFKLRAGAEQTRQNEHIQVLERKVLRLRKGLLTNPTGNGGEKWKSIWCDGTREEWDTTLKAHLMIYL